MILHVFLPQTTHRKLLFTFQLVDHDKRAITSIVSSHTQVVEKYTGICSISKYKPQSLILKFMLQETDASPTAPTSVIFVKCYFDFLS